jgi:hypothetical protein
MHLRSKGQLNLFFLNLWCIFYSLIVGWSFAILRGVLKLSLWFVWVTFYHTLQKNTNYTTHLTNKSCPPDISWRSISHMILAWLSGTNLGTQATTKIYDQSCTTTLWAPPPPPQNSCEDKKLVPTSSITMTKNRYQHQIVYSFTQFAGRFHRVIPASW